jgi:hypothetical protein
MTDSIDFSEVVQFWGESDLEVQNGTEKIELRIDDCIFYSFTSSVDTTNLQIGKKYFGGVNPCGDFGVLFDSLEDVVSCAVNNLHANIDIDATLLIAKALKDNKKETAKLAELERQQKVYDLLDTISNLHPEKSKSILKELFSIARAKDFKETFVHTISGTINVCSYDGATLTIFKQNGEISVKSLPYRIFVERFGAKFANYTSFLKGSISYEYFESETGFALTSSECFETWKNQVIENYAKKASKNYDSNLSTIYKRKMEIVALVGVNKVIGKPNAKKVSKK